VKDEDGAAKSAFGKVGQANIFILSLSWFDRLAMRASS
jgi:hypothetical protein